MNTEKINFKTTSPSCQSIFNQNKLNTEKQNRNFMNNLASYSSCNSHSVPKQILQKTIQSKNEHINELMEELKRTKSSYEEFKSKIAEENTKLKQQNAILRRKLDPVIKQKQEIKKYCVKLQQQREELRKALFLQKQAYEQKALQFNKKIDQLSERNAKLSKCFETIQKTCQQLQTQKSQLIQQNQNLQLKIQNLSKQESAQKIKLNEIIEKKQAQNKLLLEQIEQLKQRKKGNQNIGRKLEKLQQRITLIMDNI